MISDQRSDGLAGSLQRVCGSLLGVLQTRVELFALELQEERANAVNLLIRLSTALFLGMLTVIVLTGTVIFLFSAEYRVYVAGAFGLVYLVGAVWAFLGLRRCLRQQANSFAETTREFRRDREWLQME